MGGSCPNLGYLHSEGWFEGLAELADVSQIVPVDGGTDLVVVSQLEQVYTRVTHVLTLKQQLGETAVER